MRRLLETGYRSQQGRIHYLTDSRGMATGNRKSSCDFIVIRRNEVCLPSNLAGRKLCAFHNAIKSGDRLKAVACGLTGRLLMSRSVMQKWRELSQKAMLHVYYSDCRSLTDHLRSEQVRRVQDKRLGIELAALRQGIWVDGELTCEAYKPHGERVAWIDTGG